jgi:hypothetical protein
MVCRINLSAYHLLPNSCLNIRMQDPISQKFLARSPQKCVPAFGTGIGRLKKPEGSPCTKLARNTLAEAKPN